MIGRPRNREKSFIAQIRRKFSPRRKRINNSPEAILYSQRDARYWFVLSTRVKHSSGPCQRPGSDARETNAAAWAVCTKSRVDVDVAVALGDNRASRQVTSGEARLILMCAPVCVCICMHARSVCMLYVFPSLPMYITRKWTVTRDTTYSYLSCRSLLLKVSQFY